MAAIMNQTEALFGFCGWLTSRDEKTIMSSSDDCAGIVNLIEQFQKENILPDVSDDWPTNLIHPSWEVAVSGRGKNAE